MQHCATDQRRTTVHQLRLSVVRDGIRSLILIAIGWLLIMVLFPAALSAAGT
jgi:TM2 domain-containing membrane protein YozV